MRDQVQTLPVGRFLSLTKKIEEDYLTKSCLSFLKQTYSSSIVRTWLQNPIHYVFWQKWLHRVKSYSKKCMALSSASITNTRSQTWSCSSPQVQLHNQRLLEIPQPFSTAEEIQLDSKFRRIMQRIAEMDATCNPTNESFRCCFRRWERLRLLSVSTEWSEVNILKNKLI